METFVAKVRYRIGSRFDPMMEERGRWKAGAGEQQDVVMSDAVIDLMAEANNQISKGELIPFKEQIGEVPPPNMERNFNGFLMRKDAVTFKVDSEKLKARIAKLKDQLLIAKFVGTKPPIREMDAWLQTLNQALRGETLTFCRNVGKGFFFLASEDSDALHNALMLSPFKSKWGTCMFQSWIPGFNPDNPRNLAFPTWVALRSLPFEHHDQALAIAESLGEVIGIDTANDTAKDPRFCINLMVNEGWVMSITLESEDGTGPAQSMIVDYDRMPIRCRACQSWKLRVRDCKEIQRRSVQGLRREPHSFQPHQHAKGKHKVLDEEGFQQVRNRKNIRRNIFDRENGFGRRHDTDLGEGDQVYQKQGQQTTARASHREEEEVSVTEVRYHKSGGQTSGSGKETYNKKQAGGQTYHIIMIEEARRDGLVGGQDIQMANLEEKKRTEPQDQEATSSGMEEDPTTNMAWSPTRIAGQKRTLEERTTEEDESDEGEFEEGEEEEGEEGSEEDSLDQERMPEEGDCEAWENDTRPENRTAEEASTGQKMREGGEEISSRDAEVTGSLGTERLASQAGSEAEHHSSQGREKTAGSEQHHTPAETGLK
jgi:hypothetical protein